MHTIFRMTIAVKINNNLHTEVSNTFICWYTFHTIRRDIVKQAKSNINFSEQKESIK